MNTIQLNDDVLLCVDLDIFALAWANRNTDGFVFARCYNGYPSSVNIPRLTVLKTGNGKILHMGQDITAMIGAYVDPVTWGRYFVDMRMVSQDFLKEAKDRLHSQILIPKEVSYGN